MKKWTVLFIVFVSALGSAQAASLTPRDPSQYQGALPEFCVFDAMASEDPDALFDVQVLDIKKVSALDSFSLALINDYMMNEGYFNQAQSFAAIQALFADGGAEEYNDLYIYSRTSKKTGQVHFEVRTYPGDNPVGRIYSAAGELLGENGDGSYTFNTAQGPVWCSSMN